MRRGGDNHAPTRTTAKEGLKEIASTMLVKPGIILLAFVKIDYYFNAPAGIKAGIGSHITENHGAAEVCKNKAESDEIERYLKSEPVGARRSTLVKRLH